MTIPVGFLLVAAAIYAAKHRGADTPGILLGVCIGVTGANGLIGDVVRQLLASAVEAGQSLTQVQVL